MRVDVERVEDAGGLDELDSFASRIPCSSPFQTGSLAAAYSRSPDCRPLALVARDAKGGIRASLVAVTFTHGRKPASLAARLSTHSTIRGSPLADPDTTVSAAIPALVTALEKALPRPTLYIRCYPNTMTVAVRALEGEGFAREDWLNFDIDLRQSEANLLASMSKRRRAGIRAAEASRLRVREVSSAPEVAELYGVLETAHRRLGIPLQRRELFDAVFSLLVPKGQALMLIADLDGETVAARVVLIHRETAYDWYAGSGLSAHPVHADELLTWRAMLTAKERRAEVFDFGGAGVPTQEYGPREFKRRFGGVETNLGRYTKVRLPSRLWVAKTGKRVLMGDPS